jgi:hypothetical protein
MVGSTLKMQKNRELTQIASMRRLILTRSASMLFDNGADSHQLGYIPPAHGLGEAMRHRPRIA